MSIKQAVMAVCLGLPAIPAAACWNSAHSAMPNLIAAIGVTALIWYLAWLMEIVIIGTIIEFIDRRNAYTPFGRL